jgi:hypothetical protein
MYVIPMYFALFFLILVLSRKYAYTQHTHTHTYVHNHTHIHTPLCLLSSTLPTSQLAFSVSFFFSQSSLIYSPLFSYFSSSPTFLFLLSSTPLPSLFSLPSSFLPPRVGMSGRYIQMHQRWRCFSVRSSFVKDPLNLCSR